MGGRTDVDVTLTPAVISGRILNELYNHALSEGGHFEECCGLIVGDETDRYQRVERCSNEMTRLHQQDPAIYPRDGKDAFYMNEHDYLRVMQKAETEGLTVTAVYHSHVGSAAYMSEMDLEYAESPLFPFPEADHIVVSVSEGAVRGLGLFDREAPGLPFRGRSVTPRVL